MGALSPHDVVGNCRIAFDAAEMLGIPRVIEPRDMSLLAVPDKLAVMTYLYQLRAHFTGHQLEIEQIGNTSDESSYVIGNYKTDNLSSQNIMSLEHLKKQLHQQNSLDDADMDRFGGDEKSPTEKKDVKNLILSSSKHLLGKVLSPTKDKNSPVGNQQSTNTPNAITPNGQKDKPILMTRRELNDPFGSDDEDDLPPSYITDNQRCNSNKKDDSPPAPNLDPATANVIITFTVSPVSINKLSKNHFISLQKLMSRHKEMSEKAKVMMERLKTTSASMDNGKDLNVCIILLFFSFLSSPFDLIKLITVSNTGRTTSSIT